MRKQQFIAGLSLTAVICLLPSGGFAAGRQPSTSSCTAIVRVTVEPYLYVNASWGIVTPCEALVLVPPPCEGKLKTVATSFTVHHNENLNVIAWRCGGLGYDSRAPKDGAKVLYKIELFASGATAPFYTSGFAPYPSLRPVSLTSFAPSQSHGEVTVRVTRQALTASWLQGDWLSLQFVRP